MSQKSTQTKVNDIPTTPIRYMWFVSREHKRFLWLAFLTVTLAEIFYNITPLIIRAIVDNATLVMNSSGEIENVWFWVIAYPVAILIQYLSWRTTGFLGLEWVTRMNATSYTTLFTYLSGHGHTYFSNRFAGSLSSKTGYASEGVQSLGEAFLWNYYPVFISLFLTAIFIFNSSIWSGLMFILLVAIMIPVNIFLAKYRRPFVNDYTSQVTKTRGLGVDAISNMTAVRQFAREKDEVSEYSSAIKLMRQLNVKQWRVSEWALVFNNIIIVIFVSTILVITITAWSKKSITLGEVIMIMALLANIQGALVFIGSSINRFIRQYAEIEEGLGDILEPHEIVDEKDALPLKLNSADITWQNVTFGYEGKLVFQDFNLHIPHGQRVGLVGSSGAGKTTFVSLLLRQHDVNSGQICITGQDISLVTQQSLRDHITVVPQEPMLFHRSIRDNIAYGKPTATKEEIIEAARHAYATDFIDELPKQYETLVGERGVKLSGGQKQRIAIARAMLKDAPIIILDEATSALDSESEVVIQKALHELMANKTVIAIAHRLSTLREMDRIIVLENGQIIEDGKHDELVAKGGTYAKLWSHQAGGFLPD